MGWKNRQVKKLQFSKKTLQIFGRIPTDSCKFQTEEIISAQNFNFAPNFFLKWDFSTSNFANVLQENFATRKNFTANFQHPKILRDRAA